MLLADIGEAYAVDGAAGGVASTLVVALAVLESAELQAPLLARTRK